MLILLSAVLEAARKVCWPVHVQLILLNSNCSSDRGCFDLHESGRFAQMAKIIGC